MQSQTKAVTCCHHATTPYEGWQRCTHPRIHTPGDLVRADGNCIGCPLRDNSAPPRELRKLDDSAAQEYFRWKSGERLTRPTNLYEGTAVVPADIPAGAGTYLKRFFARFYIKADGKCGCEKLAREMDVNGPAWCEENFDFIIGKLRENARKRGLPFSELLAKGLLRRAIDHAKKTQATMPV